MTRKRVALGVSAVLIALVAAYFVSRTRTAEDPTEGATIVTLRRGELVETASASGTIEPHVQVEVKSRSAGEVVEVHVVEGQRVEAGALLFRIDPVDATRGVAEARASARRTSAELAQARANLAIAEAEAEDSRTTREVRARGAELGLVTAEEDRSANRAQVVAESGVRLRRAQVDASAANLAAARLAVAEAERRLVETEIRAPIAGTILSVDVERGSIVASAVTNVGGGGVLATLADLTDLRVIGRLDEAQIGAVTVGHPVRVRVDAYPDRVFTGRVERVSPLGRTESNVVTFDVEVVITDAQAHLLRSGMSADLEIETGRQQNVVLCPLVAIQSSGPDRTVRLVSGETRRIVTGPTDGTHIVVREGVREGDRILVGGVSRAAPASSGGALPFGPRPGGRR